MRQDDGQRGAKDRSLIGAVGEQPDEKGEETKQPRQQSKAAVAILNIGGGDAAAQKQSFGVDQNMPLLTFDQLARIKAGRIDAKPPCMGL